MSDQQDRIQSLSNLQVFFDTEAFDDAVRAHGVVFLHFRAMACPVGIIDPFSPRRPHDDHSGCSNGFLYTMAGKMSCLFVGNSIQPQFQDVGELDSAGASITLPQFYDDGSPVYIAPFDRLYLAEESIVVVDWQLHEMHASGKDKLNYPIVKVQDLVDCSGVRYTEGKDFEIQQGQIVWIGDRPIFDADTDKGPVYAVRYLYRPYFYIKRLEHEVRVAHVDDQDGDRHTVRLPQTAVLQREYIFESADKDPQSVTPTNYRQVKGPREGSLGPR